MARRAAFLAHEFPQDAGRAGRGAEADVLVPQRQPQPRMTRRLPDHRAAVGQGGAPAQPGFPVQPPIQREGLAGARLGQFQLVGPGGGLAVGQFHARGQPQAAGHGRQHVAAARIVHRARQARAFQAAVVQVIAPLERQGQGYAGRLQQTLGPGAQRHHQLVRRQRRGCLPAPDRPARAVAADLAGIHPDEGAAAAAEQLGVGRRDFVRIVHGIRALDPQRPGEDGRQRGFELGQLGGVQGLRRHLVPRVGPARQFAAVPGLLRAVQQHPAGIAQPVRGAGLVQQAQVLGHGQADQAVQGRHGFLEDRGAGIEEKAGGPAQVGGQVAPPVAELDGVVPQESRQLPPQAGVVERHERAAGDHAGIAQRGLAAGFLPVDQRDRHAPAR